MNYIFLVVVFLVFILLVNSMYQPSDYYMLPKEFVLKNRIKEKSILRKVTPIFEKEEKGYIGLYIRAIPVLISEIIIVIAVCVFFIDLKYNFIIDKVYLIISAAYVGSWLLYELAISLMKHY